MTDASVYLPLAHKTVVLTRRRQDAAALAQALEALGAQVLIAPSLQIEALPRSVWQKDMAALAQASCVAFASRQGVIALAQALRLGNWTLPKSAALWAVGPSTAEVAQKQFARPVRLQMPYTAEGMAAALKQSLAPGCDNVVLPTAQQGRAHVIAQGLRQTGIFVTTLPLYQTTPLAGPRPFLPGCVDYVVFTSPSGVAGWQLGGAHPTGARCVSIGPTTSKALQQAGLPIFAQASIPTTQGIIAALLEKPP